MTCSPNFHNWKEYKVTDDGITIYKCKNCNIKIGDKIIDSNKNEKTVTRIRTFDPFHITRDNRRKWV